MPENTHSSPDGDTTPDRFESLEGAARDRVDDFLRDRVAFTAREWAIARLCADFRTKTGVEMTTVGEELPDLVPFVHEPYSRQAVYQARRSFEEKVRTAGATFCYGAFADFFTADELDDVLYEATEVARFLIEVEGLRRSHADESRSEAQVRSAMESVHRASRDLRYDRCPNCGHELDEDAIESD
ncbi:DUF5806 family protein [Halovivax limisalsi]|uniref:DUF5806 family protein n=1 Tax=Halovivax limisalsi TaxID=1453760 RepID=UPI001FFD9236|nr:DUF5806 family protein [Halovivax limisalsi]